MRAFAYLVWRSGRNRIVSSVRRARSPRYAAALIVGVLYLWGFLFRPTTSGAVTSVFLGQPTEMVLTLLLVVTLAGSWVFGSDTTALAFTQAELSFLFPAPLSRRALIRYKLFRAQIVVLINAMIWVFVLRRGGGPLPSVLRAISLWVLFSSLNLHRLGAALVRSSWREHGAAGARRHRWSIAAFALICAAVVANLVMHWSALTTASGVGAFFSTLANALTTAPGWWALFPFHAVIAPIFATTIPEWAREMAPAVVVLAIHAAWVLRTDAAFEDAAIDASAERARRLEAMRTRRTLAATVAPRAAKATAPLATAGPPGLAILWKNILCLRRTAQLRLLIGPVLMSIAFGAAFSTDGAEPAAIVTRSAAIFAVLLVVFGGRLIRNDLRQDMQHLPLLKTLPIAPGDLMLAEVASAALPMAALQMALVLIAYVAALLWADVPLTAGTRLGILVASPVAIVALNGALLTIQNGIAVLFPSWIRLGPAVTTGVEALGQNVLATIANLFSLAVALIIPMVVAFAALSGLSAIDEPGVAPLALAIVVAAAILGAETYAALRLLGRAFAKAEPGNAG
jgi:Putative ABC exporter